MSAIAVHAGRCPCLRCQEERGQEEERVAIAELLSVPAADQEAAIRAAYRRGRADASGRIIL